MENKNQQEGSQTISKSEAKQARIRPPPREIDCFDILQKVLKFDGTDGMRVFKSKLVDRILKARTTENDF